MRVPSFPTLLRTFYTVNNTTRLLPAFNTSNALLQPFYQKAIAATSYTPSMSFFSSLFSSSAPKQEMSFPVNKSKDEWQAILSPGKHDASCAESLCAIILT